jgi:cell wall-associated NlpC family hydrolase
MPLPGTGAGAYSYKQLEQLWVSAGGNKAVAPLMAAIAMAESGGNPNAYNPSGASGLWQILGAPDNWHGSTNWMDPAVNARAAVAKYKTQGLDAWTTYTSGAYRKFLQTGAAKGVITGQEILSEAEKFKGDPYVWGGTSPKGFDCSGLVQYVLEKLGMKNVPRTSEAQWGWVRKITKSQLQPGDLVFFAGSDGTDTSPGHVAIYAGRNKIYQALETGTDVGLFDMDSAGTPVGYGRIPGTYGQGAGGTGSEPTGGGGGFDWSQWLNDLGGGLADLNAGASPTNFLESLTGDLQGGGSITGAAGPLAGIATVLTDFEQHVAWFFQPNHWVRIICGSLGTGFVLGGILMMARTGRGYEVSVPVYGQVPAPGGQLAPAMGIALVTVGAIFLFVAFHNLPHDVDNFGGFVSYLQGELQRGGKQAE